MKTRPGYIEAMLAKAWATMAGLYLIVGVVHAVPTDILSVLSRREESQVHGKKE
jgi:hypothetical protein